ncbi:hypothetical protein AAV35_011375 [Salimicrobium jeotgali]|uniref:DUF4209 domain-containing protein n=2 Tax=Salimicrobium jeotgali TaxID=1230341 RepID=K2FJT3_9BACI|nr:DUF4209 domain-containing protein [Salimicrobium jeotgali]AKG05316.1 hypothetical protein AAV35_011375 [Salimicrobium jeotgali]EKE31321.1 hypothetical protein MJ3_08796 [Salimicrobium jeotgali]
MENGMESLLKFVPQSYVDDGKMIATTQANTTEEKEAFEFSRYYDYLLKVIGKTLLIPIFTDILEGKDLQAEDIMQFLNEWDLLDVRNELIINQGVKNYFGGDYISALHILVPQLEATIRNMFAKAGYATTVIRPGVVQFEQTFNEFINREDVKQVLGDDLQQYINFVLVNQLGLNLSNSIAHGLISPEHLNRYNTILVIHIYLCLTRFEVNKDLENDKK